MYDAGRQIPVITVLVAIGLLACLLRFRGDERSRAVLLLWLSSLLLFFGPPTLGPLLNLLPGSNLLFYHRFIMGIHLTGLILAGVGALWLGQHLLPLLRRGIPLVRPALAAAGATVLLVLSLYPAWAEISRADAQGASTQSMQQLWDSTDGADLQFLIDSIKTLSPGRVYAGSRWSWGQDYKIGWVPVYCVLSNQDIDTVGFKLRVSSLMSDAEMLFDEGNPVDYELFGVRYLLLPADRKPAVPATLLAQQGRHTLWQVDTNGYFDVVDTTWPPITESNGSIATNAQAILYSPQLGQHQLPTVAFNGADAAAPSLAPGSPTPQGPGGRVDGEDVSLNDGTFTTDVVANRQAVVLLKASYDPHWRVTVDGVESRPDMIAPALMGRTVSAGRHHVSFRYVPDPEERAFAARIQ